MYITMNILNNFNTLTPIDVNVQNYLNLVSTLKKKQVIFLKEDINSGFKLFFLKRKITQF